MQFDWLLSKKKKKSFKSVGSSSYQIVYIDPEK